MRRAISTFFATALLSLSVNLGAQIEVDRPSPLRLLPGYKHTAFRGIDSAPGKIYNDKGFVFEYDFGGLPENYSNIPKEQTFWRREQRLHGHTVEVVMSKQGKMIITFLDTRGKDGIANFFGEPVSKEEVADMLLMAMTFDDKADKK